MEIWQELEQDKRVMKKILEVGGQGGYSVGLWDEERRELGRVEDDEEDEG